MYSLKLGQKEISAKNSGNKAYFLSKASPIAVIPKGFVIMTEAFDHFLEINGLKSIPAIDLENSRRIQELIYNGTFDETLSHEIGQNLLDLKAPFLVRSSSTAEDTEAHSFAGLFESFQVDTPEEVLKKIKQVYASLYNERAIRYAYNNRIDLRTIEMAVIVQEMIKGDKFGVGFCLKNEDGDEIHIIESSTESSSAVTAGTTIPDTYVLNKSNIYKYPAYFNINSLFEFELMKIKNLMKSLDKILFPLDIEWGIEGNQLYLLQMRPLTRQIPVLKGNQLLSGLPASSGRVCGRAVIWKKQRSLKTGKDRILVAEEVEIGDVYIIKKFGGVVVEVAGLTSHAAIIAREYGIPCIVGAGEITHLIKSGEPICIDGDSGEITFQKRHGFSVNRTYSPIYIDPRKLIYFRLNNDFVLFYSKNAITLIYHAGLKEGLEELTSRLRPKVNGPLIDGGVDIWYGYGMILEMSQLNSDLYQDFLTAIQVMDQLDESMIEKTLDKFISTCDRFYLKAAEYWNSYHNTKSPLDLKQALHLIDIGFAYWKIIGHCMFYDYAEYLLHTPIDINKQRMLQNLIIKMQNWPNFRKVSESIINLVGEILDAIKGDLQIDYGRYSSVIALLSAIVAPK